MEKVNENGGVIFTYQPIVACNETIFLVESSIERHADNSNAMQPPEYSRLFACIADFDFYVIDGVLREIVSCSTILLIGVASSSLVDEHFIDKVVQKSREYKNVKLCLAVTDYFGVNDRDLNYISNNVRKLRREGILISLDDFGSSSSSDKILFHVEFDYVMLDSFFTEGLSDDYVKFNLLLNTVKKIRDTYGYRIIVKGVEDSLTSELIKEIGILARAPLFMQGDFFHKPDNWAETECKLGHDSLVDIEWMSLSSLYEQLVFLVSKYKILKSGSESDSLSVTTNLINCIEMILSGSEFFNGKKADVKTLIEESKSLSLSGKKLIADGLLSLLDNGVNSHVDNYFFKRDDILFHCLDVSGLLFAIRDEHGNHLYTNKRYDDFFGRRMKGMNIRDVFSFMPHAEAKQIDICLEHDELTLRSNMVHSAIEVFVVGGVEMYFETKREPISIGGSKYILLSVQDVTGDLVKNVRGDLSAKDNIDSLTRAFNRHYLDVVDPANYTSCVFIDLDGFKLANDTNGHEYGDSILKRVCQIAASEFRPTDAIIRFGGDELVILSSLEDINKLTHRILCVRSQLEQEFDDISFSFGVCSIGDNLKDAIANSDLLMYENKKSRKNANISTLRRNMALSDQE